MVVCVVQVLFWRIQSICARLPTTILLFVKYFTTTKVGKLAAKQKMDELHQTNRDNNVDFAEWGKSIEKTGQIRGCLFLFNNVVSEFFHFWLAVIAHVVKKTTGRYAAKIQGQWRVR